MEIQRSFNVLGNIAVVNFSDGVKNSKKKKFAKELLNKHSNIKTVLEKSGNFKGRLRKMETKFLAGEKNKEVLYKENGCVFRFNIDTTYFSPRLSNERKEVSDMIDSGTKFQVSSVSTRSAERKKNEVFVMFAGVGPFSIVIAKNSKSVGKVYSNEINREANKYAKLNVDLNKVKDKVELVNGDVKRISKKLKLQKKKFDYIVMPRPNLKESFLNQAFGLSKKGTEIFYYGFCKIEDIDKVVEMIKEKASENKKKIKILKTKHAGEIAPYKIRVRVDFKVLN
jgi:tRNA (guanine37-N1)-methyltransferase